MLNVSTGSHSKTSKTNFKPEMRRNQLKLRELLTKMENVGKNIGATSEKFEVVLNIF